MADRRQAKDAVAADLRSLAEDLKALVDDPRKRARKEWQWRLLYGALALGFTMASRQLAAKAWAILTGEQPPTKGGAPTRAPRSEPTATAAGGPH